MAVALSAITGTPVRIRNIRARRHPPGLSAQHLTAIRAVATLSDGQLLGDALRASEITFFPGDLRAGSFSFDVTTAGSIALVLQAVLPVAVRAPGPTQITVTGGTDVRGAPPIDYLIHVILPWLRRLNVEADIRVQRRGYYPRGGGLVTVEVTPADCLYPLNLESTGPLLEIFGAIHASNLPAHIPQRMATAARDCFPAGTPIHFHTRMLGPGDAVGTGGALVIWARTESTLLGAATVAQRGIPSEQLGDETGRALASELAAGATLDVHAADQLAVYMALAEAPSTFWVREVSSHLQTLLWLLNKIRKVESHIAQRGNRYHIEIRASEV